MRKKLKPSVIEKRKQKKNLINYCKTKLIKAKIYRCNGKTYGCSKHIDILSLYEKVFESNPIADYHKYIENLVNKRDGYIYVIGNKEYKLCKIGFSKNVFKRIKSIQTGCPFELEIFCVVYGDYVMEKKLHRKYQNLKMNGEWFKYEGELEKSIIKTESVITDLLVLKKK